MLDEQKYREVVHFSFVSHGCFEDDDTSPMTDVTICREIKVCTRVDRVMSTQSTQQRKHYSGSVEPRKKYDSTTQVYSECQLLPLRVTLEYSAYSCMDFGTHLI